MIGCVCDNIGCVGYSNYMDSHGDHMVVTTLIYIGCRVCVCLAPLCHLAAELFKCSTHSSALTFKGGGGGGPISETLL